MNRCDVGEDETTNALNALYIIPPPANGIPPVGHLHVSSSGLTTASTFSVNGHAEQSRKRKSVPGDRSSVIEGCHSAQASAYPVSSQHAASRVRSTADSNHYPTERNSVSKSVDPFTDKKKSKSKSRGSYSDGGSVIVPPSIISVIFDTLSSLCFYYALCIHIYLSTTQEILWNDPRSIQKEKVRERWIMMNIKRLRKLRRRIGIVLAEIGMLNMI
jgi:hypothetical protein